MAKPMKRRVSISEAAQADYTSATEYLAELSPRLPEQFENELLAFAACIDQQPEMYPILEAPYRVGRLSKFPYSVVYTYNSTTIELLAIYHHARNPSELSTRLTPDAL
jgi:plasmid stabilization system protein ParE